MKYYFYCEFILDCIWMGTILTFNCNVEYLKFYFWITDRFPDINIPMVFGKYEKNCSIYLFDNNMIGTYNDTLWK